MKYGLLEKVKTQNMDGQYNNAPGTIIEAFPAGTIDSVPVYMVQYDVPFGSCTKGMFKESDLTNLEANHE